VPAKLGSRCRQGGGIRLFDGVDREKASLRILEAIPSLTVTNLRYAVTHGPGLDSNRTVNANPSSAVLIPASGDVKPNRVA